MSRASPRVLLIEDHPDIRETLGRLFTREGFEVVAADNGTDAITLARRSRIDVVATDLELPDIPGVDVVRTLRTLRAATCRIVVYSGLGEADAREALTAGADIVLTKE